MNTLTPFPAHAQGMRPLAEAYTALILAAADTDHSLSPLALAGHTHDEAFIPLHGSTVQVLASLSRTVTADLEALAALRQALAELYETDWLSAAQLNALLEVAVRTDDLAAAEHHGLTLVATTGGRVWSEAYGRALHFATDQWLVTAGSTSAHHPKLSQSIRLALVLRDCA